MDFLGLATRNTEAGQISVIYQFGFHHVFGFDFMVGERSRHVDKWKTSENQSGLVKQMQWNRSFPDFYFLDHTQRTSSLPGKR